MSASEAIRAIIARSGMTHCALSRKLGIDRRTICGWISGRHGITEFNLDCLLQACSATWGDWAALRDGRRRYSRA